MTILRLPLLSFSSLLRIGLSQDQLTRFNCLKINCLTVFVYNLPIQARAAIAEVMSLSPETAVIESSGMQVPVETVEVGTLLAVRPGETVPIDGIVENGSSTVDESSLTGESVPVKKEKGDQVFAGTINMTGMLLNTFKLLYSSTLILVHVYNFLMYFRLFICEHHLPVCRLRHLQACEACRRSPKSTIPQ